MSRSGLHNRISICNIENRLDGDQAEGKETSRKMLENTRERLQGLKLEQGWCKRRTRELFERHFGDVCHQCIWSNDQRRNVYLFTITHSSISEQYSGELYGDTLPLLFISVVAGKRRALGRNGKQAQKSVCYSVFLIQNSFILISVESFQNITVLTSRKCSKEETRMLEGRRMSRRTSEEIFQRFGDSLIVLWGQQMEAKGASPPAAAVWPWTSHSISQSFSRTSVAGR